MPPRCPCLVLARTYTSTISRTRKRYYAPRGISLLPRRILSHAYASIISLPVCSATVSLFTPYLPAGYAGRYNLPKDFAEGEETLAEAMREKARFSSHPRRNAVIINMTDQRDDTDAGGIEESDRRDRNSSRFED